jgi:hypothetical protein
MDDFESYKSLQISERTKRQYGTAMKSIIEWVKNNYPDSYNGSTNELIIPLPDEVIKKLYPAFAQKKDGTRYSKSHVQQYDAAIKDYYRKKQLVLTTAIQCELKGFERGLKRKIAQAKHEGVMPFTEGKAPFSFESYRSICKLAVQSTNITYLYAHTFCILAWNLMARASSVADILFEHITWEQDAMVIR